MLSIDKSGNITINRGDTFKVPIFIDISKDIFHNIRFPFTQKDELYFFLLEPNTSIKHPLLMQVYTRDDLNENGDIVLKFIHDDTDWIVPGTYYYEIKLRAPYQDGMKDALVTVVPRRKFTILS